MEAHNVSEYLMDTYARMPVAFTRGEGAWLFDAAGKRYLDGTSGLGVTALGHAHPAVADTLCDQARTLIHTANLAHVPWQETLAEKLCGVAGMQRVFICNSGTEAIECAFKICRLTARERGIDDPEVVVMSELSATGSDKVRSGFEPLVSGFIRAPFGDVDALESIAAERPNVVAVLLEPIQGESGVRVPPAGYLSALRALCDRHGWLLVCDEIQTGLCRTGRWYDCHHENVLPDLLTTAKALANGFPIGACLGRGAAARAFTPGRHGTTFGGNPLACRTACTVLDLMAEMRLYERAAATGARMLEQFRSRLADNSLVTDIRGRGLMMGIETTMDINALKFAALDRGLVMNVTHDTIVRLLPPLIIDAEQAGFIVETVCDLLNSLEA